MPKVKGLSSQEEKMIFYVKRCQNNRLFTVLSFDHENSFVCVEFLEERYSIWTKTFIRCTAHAAKAKFKRHKKSPKRTLKFDFETLKCSVGRCDF